MVRAAPPNKSGDMPDNAEEETSSSSSFKNKQSNKQKMLKKNPFALYIRSLWNSLYKKFWSTRQRKGKSKEQTDQEQGKKKGKYNIHEKNVKGENEDPEEKAKFCVMLKLGKVVKKIKIIKKLS